MKTYSSTVPATECELLTTAEKCRSCMIYRATLRKLYNRWSKRCLSPLTDSDVYDHKNFWYMNTQEKKAKVHKLKRRAHVAQNKVQKLQANIES